VGCCRCSVCALFDGFNILLKQFNSPANAKEIFNLRHAHARNVIEHIFGVLKQHFRILLLPPHYPLDFQPRIPVALCALQNFIQETDSNEGTLPTDLYQSAYTPLPFNAENDNGGFITDVDDDGNSEFKLRRLNIANAMWRSYLDYLERGGRLGSDGDPSE